MEAVGPGSLAPTRGLPLGALARLAGALSLACIAPANAADPVVPPDFHVYPSGGVHNDAGCDPPNPGWCCLFSGDCPDAGALRSSEAPDWSNAFGSGQ